MSRSRPVLGLVLSLLIFGALSGCLGDEKAPVGQEDTQEGPDPYVPTGSGEKRASALTANDTVAAPEWALGDWFGHHVYQRGGNPAGRHYNTVVIDGGGGWTLAPDDAEAAKEEAAWDLPVAGRVAAGLATTAYGAAWDFFRFPLHDGKTWQGEVQVRDLEQWVLLTYDASFEVTFDEAIEVNGEALRGFRIVATTGDDDVVVDASYIPAIRWYGHITVHDVRTDDPDDPFLHTVSMGYGRDWTGTYHVAEGDVVIEHYGGFVAFQPQAVTPVPPQTFDVPDTADDLFGIVVAYSWAGASGIVLVDPEGQPREMHATHADPLDRDGDIAFRTVDEPAVAGTWAVASAGAGPVWIAVVYLFAFDMQEHEM